MEYPDRRELGRKIPRSIQEKVISKWLEGKPRDLVARELKISGGSVTSIIQGRRRKDRQFDLLRVVAIKLRELGIDIESFSSLVRFRQLIKGEYTDSGKPIEVEEEEVDSLIEAFCVFCFNRNMTVPRFGNMVLTLCQMADKFVLALYDLPMYVTSLEKTANAMIKELVSLKMQKARLLRDYEITTDVIDDILSNGPYMLGAYQVMKVRLREMEKERNEYKIQLKYAKMEIRAREIERARKTTRGRFSFE
jgi:hypothetical protein